MNLYFAYGSNMNQEQMLERCPDAKLLGMAELPGYQLAFTIYSPTRKCGCADVLDRGGSTVYGLLYMLTDEDAVRMDRFEGSPTHYKRIPILVVQDGEEVAAFTYAVVTKKEGLAPSSHYVGLIRAAAKEFNFPEKYQQFLSEFKTQ